MKMNILNMCLLATVIVSFLKVFGLFEGPWLLAFAPILFLVAIVIMALVFMSIGAILLLWSGAEIKIKDKIYKIR